jgi:hypothetical protein
MRHQDVIKVLSTVNRGWKKSFLLAVETVVLLLICTGAAQSNAGAAMQSELAFDAQVKQANWLADGAAGREIPPAAIRGGIVKPQGGDGGGNGGSGGGNSGGDSHSPGGDQTRENTNLCGSAALALGGVGLLLLNRRVKRQNRQADR